MAKLIAIHKMPADSEQYRSYYVKTHVPLALALPGLRKYELSTGSVATEVGLLRVLLVATLHFDSVEAARNALDSAEGHAAMEDVPKFATDTNVEILIEDLAA